MSTIQREKQKPLPAPARDEEEFPSKGLPDELLKDIDDIVEEAEEQSKQGRKSGQ